MDWSEVAAKNPICLNLGGGINCHPASGYQDLIAVDINPPVSDWTIGHDLRKPIPLPDGSVTRIHTEDFLEHIAVKDIEALLVECFRLLKTGGTMRIGVPDYNNPKDRFCLKLGNDPRDEKHVTLTTYALMKPVVENSPFSRHKFYHYWDGDTFIQEPIDYSQGMIKRTPDNDRRCRRNGAAQQVSGFLKDSMYRASKGFRCSKIEMLSRKGHRFYVTSLVVDLFKD